MVSDPGQILESAASSVSSTCPGSSSQSQSSAELSVTLGVRVLTLVREINEGKMFIQDSERPKMT